MSEIHNKSSSSSTTQPAAHSVQNPNPNPNPSEPAAARSCPKHPQQGPLVGVCGACLTDKLASLATAPLSEALNSTTGAVNSTQSAANHRPSSTTCAQIGANQATGDAIRVSGVANPAPNVPIRATGVANSASNVPIRVSDVAKPASNGAIRVSAAPNLALNDTIKVSAASNSESNDAMEVSAVPNSASNHEIRVSAVPGSASNDEIRVSGVANPTKWRSRSACERSMPVELRVEKITLRALFAMDDAEQLRQSRGSSSFHFKSDMAADVAPSARQLAHDVSSTCPPVPERIRQTLRLGSLLRCRKRKEDLDKDADRAKVAKMAAHDGAPTNHNAASSAASDATSTTGLVVCGPTMTRSLSYSAASTGSGGSAFSHRLRTPRLPDFRLCPEKAGGCRQHASPTAVRMTSNGGGSGAAEPGLLRFYLTPVRPSQARPRRQQRPPGHQHTRFWSLFFTSKVH